MTNRRPAICALPSLALALTLTGCPGPVIDRPAEGGAGMPLENKFKDDLAFEDIPVPRNFKQDDKESWSKVFQKKGNVRLAHLVYHGGAFPKETIKFYEEQMVSLGWEKTHDELIKGSGAKLLIFSRSLGTDREECKITILRANRVTTVTVDIE